MAQNYIARGEPTTVSATTTPSTTYITAGGAASFSIDNSAGGNVVEVATFVTSAGSSGNVIVLPGQSKIVAPLQPPLSPSNVSIVVTALSGTATVYITPIVSQQG
jgi:hypothetical protein